jgi:hypothetical protein
LNREVATTDESIIEYLDATKNIQLIQVRDDYRKTTIQAKGGVSQTRGGLDPNRLLGDAALALIKKRVLLAHNSVALLER